MQADDGNEAYTLRGDLQVDGNGMITSAGKPVIGDGGPLVVPLGSALSLGADGTISAIGAGEDPDAIVEVGRLKLVTPVDGGLSRGIDGLFRALPNAEGEVPDLPADEDARLMSGALEGSNCRGIHGRNDQQRASL